MTTPNDGPENYPPRQWGPRDWPASDDVVALEDADSHFTPPRPRRVLATTDPLRQFAGVGAVLLPILAIVALIFRAALGPVSTGAILFSTVAFIGCLVTLLAKMPTKKQTNDTDDGAVL